MHTPDFVRRTDTGANPMALRAHAPRLLEVHLLWDELVLDTLHTAPDSAPLMLGEALGWRWRCLGVDMGWVRPELRHLAAVAPPLWSEVEQAPKCDLFAPADLLGGDEQFPIARWEDGEAIVTLPAGWTAEFGHHGRPWAFTADTEITVPADALLRIRRDELALVFSRVRAPLALAGRPQLGPDGPFAGVFSFIAALGLIFGFAMWSQPPAPENEIIEVPDEFVSLIFQAPEPPPPPTPEEPAAPKEKAAGEEGKIGKEDGNVAKAKAPKGVEDKRMAESAGLFAAADVFSDAGVFGGGGLDDGLLDSLRGLHGPKGTQIGTGGLGRIGDGPGGGGEAEGTNIDGTCIGGLERCGTAPVGVIGGEGKREGGPGNVQADPIIMGGMDRSLIDEVVKQHMASIRYCFQRELQKSPGLGGKIVVGFTIAKDGSVSKATPKRSTMDSAEVESCVSGRFLKMQFPEPRGGGIVIVSYPFLFAPS